MTLTSRRFLFWLLAQIFVILAVIVIFKMIANRQLAAVFAGALFVILPAALFWRERQILFKEWLGLLCVVQFFL